MKDVRSILVDQDSVLVVEVVGVAGDVWTLVHHQHAFAELRGNTLGHGCSRKASTHDEVVVVLRYSTLSALRTHAYGRLRCRLALFANSIHLAEHSSPGAIPRGVCKFMSNTRTPLSVLARAQRTIQCRCKLLRIRTDVYQSRLAIGGHDVVDWRRHHTLACGEILRSLGGRDVTRRFVDRKGKQSRVPAGQIARQLTIRLAAEIMQVGCLRQRRSIDLNDRTKQNKVNFRSHLRKPGN